MLDQKYPRWLLDWWQLDLDEIRRNSRSAPALPTGEDIARAFEAINTKADGLYVVDDALVTTNRIRIVTLALEAQLPEIFNNDSFVQAGGLMRAAYLGQ